MAQDLVAQTPSLPESEARLFDQVCDHLAAGKSMAEACKNVGQHLSRLKFLGWLRQYPELREPYMAAKREAAEAFADEVLEIADDARNDWMESNDPNNPGWVANKEHIHRSRLRVDTRKWLAGKLMPKVYGDLEANKGVVAVQVNVITGVPEPLVSTPST